MPHLLQGGDDGALPGQLYLGYLTSSPGLFLVVVTVDCGVSLEAIDANDGILKAVTSAVFLVVTEAVTVEVTGAATGGGAGAGAKTGSMVNTGSCTEARTGVGTGAVALEAWWRAARCRPRSFSAGPRWRGLAEEKVGGDGLIEVPGRPRLRFKDMFSFPSMVFRLREASPPRDQTEINYAKEAFTKLELLLLSIFKM